MYIKGHNTQPLAFAVITNDRSFIGLAMQGRIQDFQTGGEKDFAVDALSCYISESYF